MKSVDLTLEPEGGTAWWGRGGLGIHSLPKQERNSPLLRAAGENNEPEPLSAHLCLPTWSIFTYLEKYPHPCRPVRAGVLSSPTSRHRPTFLPLPYIRLQATARGSAARRHRPPLLPTCFDGCFPAGKETAKLKYFLSAPFMRRVPASVPADDSMALPFSRNFQ